MRHRIAAHPIAISWAVSALALNAALLGCLLQGSLIWVSWATLALIIGLSILAYFIGMLLLWPLFRVVCSKINGAPFGVGERVLILTGPHRGRLVSVYEITAGQGGWNLLRLELGQDAKDSYKDIFEEYAVVRRSEIQETVGS